MPIEKEKWLKIPGFKNYEVSNRGKIKSLERTVKCFLNNKGILTIRKTHLKEKILSQALNGSGYLTVGLSLNGLNFTHQVGYWVLTAFRCAKPDGLTVSHLDGNPLNNNISNLIWESQEENLNRRMKRTKYKLNIESVLEIRRMIKEKIKPSIIAEKMGVSSSNIRYIKRNEIWSHVQLNGEYKCE